MTPSEPNRKPDIRVLVLMQHRMVREGIALLLESDPSISEVLTVDETRDLLDQVRAAAPDVVVVDLDDVSMSGKALQELGDSTPDARFVGVAGSDNVELAGRAVMLGIDAVYVKSSRSDLLASTIVDVASGLSPSLSERAELRPAGAEGLERGEERVTATLTPRELEVLEEFAKGQSTAKVADGLGISPLTVQSHVKSILVKLGVHSKIEAVTMAFRLGLVQTPLPDGRDRETRNRRFRLG